MIQYGKLTKAEILSILYNNAKAKGLGIFFYEFGDMSLEQAEKLLTKKTSFNYIKGRGLNINLKSDTQFDETEYDKINGENSAKNAIEDYLLGKKDGISL